jgi:PBP1b-binding outer membrane lipoprotein LpoB
MKKLSLLFALALAFLLIGCSTEEETESTQVINKTQTQEEIYAEMQKKHEVYFEWADENQTAYVRLQIQTMSGELKSYETSNRFFGIDLNKGDYVTLWLKNSSNKCKFNVFNITSGNVLADYENIQGATFLIK